MKKSLVILLTSSLLSILSISLVQVSAHAATTNESSTTTVTHPTLRMPLEVGAGSGYSGADWQDML